MISSPQVIRKLLTKQFHLRKFLVVTSASDLPDQGKTWNLCRTMKWLHWSPQQRRLRRCEFNGPFGELHTPCIGSISCTSYSTGVAPKCSPVKLQNGQNDRIQELKMIFPDHISVENLESSLTSLVHFFFGKGPLKSAFRSSGHPLDPMPLRLGSLFGNH